MASPAMSRIICQREASLQFVLALRTPNGSEAFRALAEDARRKETRAPGKITEAFTYVRGSALRWRDRFAPAAESPAKALAEAPPRRGSPDDRSDMGRGGLQAERDLAESRPGNIPALNVMAGHGAHVAEFPLRRMVVEYRAGPRHALQPLDGAPA